ncbi:DUF4037 domain-containing protein [Hamadaea sp. NPDC051192]|uniref:DUF4037 domain-containing protein n=1 Tax=Hamadaea sp. NPDC051192 TaxID=3154940 RepID=UPI003443BE51
MTVYSGATAVAEVRAVLDPFLRRLCDRPEVVGVVILSSLAHGGARDTFDERSDIDLTIWIDTDVAREQWHPNPLAVRSAVASRLPRWLPNFSFHVPLPWGPVEVNAHQRLLRYDQDPRTVWSDGMREAHAYTAEVVHDPKGTIRRLIADRIVLTPSERDTRLLHLAARLHWDIERIPSTMGRRGDPAAGHLVLGATVDEMLEMIYLLAGRYPPARKWRLDGLRRHNVADSAEETLLRDALRVADLGELELQRRIRALSDLWSRLAARLPSHLPVGEDAYQRYSAIGSGNRQLLSRTFADDLSAMPFELPDAAHDIANYLLVGSMAELAELAEDDIQSLPAHWHPLARRLQVAAHNHTASGQVTT